jgi:hypothetical protein
MGMGMLNALEAFVIILLLLQGVRPKKNLTDFLNILLIIRVFSHRLSVSQFEEL